MRISNTLKLHQWWEKTELEVWVLEITCSPSMLLYSSGLTLGLLGIGDIYSNNKDTEKIQGYFFKF